VTSAATLPRSSVGRALVGGAVLLVLAGVLAAPSSTTLPGPTQFWGVVAAAVVLATGVAIGIVFPVEAYYATVVLAVLEGAFRKWVLNDITVFMLKDFVLLGVYGAVLPRLSRADYRRPLWLLIPLAALVLLALGEAPLSATHTQALIGLRGYFIYVPLLWVAPAIISSPERRRALVLLVLGLAFGEAILALFQIAAGPGGINKLVSGAQYGIVTIRGHAYLRPSGTFMQNGTLSAFALPAVLFGLATVVASRRAQLVALGLTTLPVLVVLVVLSGSRGLFGCVVPAVAVFVVSLVVQRRLGTLAAAIAASAIGLAVLLLAFTASAAVAAWVSVAITLVAVATVRVEAVRVRVLGRVARPRRIATFAVIAAAAVVAPILVLQLARGGGGTVVGGLVARGTGTANVGAETGSGVFATRIRPELRRIRAAGLRGHGPGTQSLGAEYDPGARILPGESEYSKVADELGLVGLAFFLWFLVALAVGSVQGARASEEPWERTTALSAAALTILLPVWLLVAYTLDFPIVGLLFYSLVGCAIRARAAS